MKILDKNLIQLNVDVASSEEAIRYMAEILQEKGYVKEGYADRVIQREKEYPTGLLGDEMGFAIPHTSPEYALRPAVCVLVPRRPIAFCQMGTEEEPIEVDVIMPLVITDSKMQLDLLKKLMALMSDTQRLAEIKSSKSEEEVLRLLAYLEEE